MCENHRRNVRRGVSEAESVPNKIPRTGNCETLLSIILSLMQHFVPLRNISLRQNIISTLSVWGLVLIATKCNW